MELVDSLQAPIFQTALLQIATVPGISQYPLAASLSLASLASLWNRTIGEPPGARVFITNVASDNGRQDFQICGQDLPDPLYSVGNSILVRLQSLSNVYSGFNASYEAIDRELRKSASCNC